MLQQDQLCSSHLDRFTHKCHANIWNQHLVTSYLVTGWPTLKWLKAHVTVGWVKSSKPDSRQVHNNKVRIHGVNLISGSLSVCICTFIAHESNFPAHWQNVINAADHLQAKVQEFH